MKLWSDMPKLCQIMPIYGQKFNNYGYTALNFSLLILLKISQVLGILSLNFPKFELLYKKCIFKIYDLNK